MGYVIKSVFQSLSAITSRKIMFEYKHLHSGAKPEFETGTSNFHESS